MLFRILKRPRSPIGDDERECSVVTNKLDRFDYRDRAELMVNGPLPCRPAAHCTTWLHLWGHLLPVAKFVPGHSEFRVLECMMKFGVDHPLVLYNTVDAGMKYCRPQCRTGIAI
jgi:hypothetical protein